MTTTTNSGTMTAPAPANAHQGTGRTPRQTAVYYVLLTFGPMTDAELVARYDALRPYIGVQYGSIAQSSSGLRSRRAELLRKGFVEKAGEKPPPSGKGRMHAQWKAI